MNNPAKILVIDDEKDMLRGCQKILEALGHKAVPVSNSKVAIQLITGENFDVIFCDLLMPEIDGFNILDFAQQNAPLIPVVIFSAYGTVDRAVSAMKKGAFDFIEKPFDADQINLVVEKAIRQKELINERQNLINQLEDRFGFDNIIGNSPEMKKVFNMIESVAETDTSILITGESGTGKELIARSIHARSKRKTKPFVPVNCGALPENLFEAELFGYEKGAFTGANKEKEGLIEYTGNGTFFLDEICELPLSLQPKLLRTLQDKKLRHVGGNKLIQVDIRLISATNRDIQSAVEKGELREDLYYRINVINIHLPPLRERGDDIHLLTNHFLEKTIKTTSKEIRGFSNEVLEAFEKYKWPGNVRELQNVVERLVTLAKGPEITINDLPKSIMENETDSISFEKMNLNDAKHKMIEDLEKKYLIYLLKKHKGNVTRVAEEAGMTRRNIHRLLNLHNFDPNIWRN